MAFADNALFGFKLYEDLLEQEILNGYNFVLLKWNKEAEALSILRHITADGIITKELIKRHTFESIFNNAVSNKGYSCPGGMHKVRRFFRKQVDGKFN
jgi:hypothetical protein